MQLLLLLSCLGLALAATPSPDHVTQELLRLSDLYELGVSPINMKTLWSNFKRRYEKTYETVDVEIKRMRIFFENMWFVKKHNKERREEKHKHRARLNEYSDLSHDEFVQTMNGFKRSYGDSLAKGHGTTFMKPHHFKAPKAVDWRKKGFVTPMKNQGHCGSCWSFSSTGALEGQHFRKTGRLVSLSEQNLVDCSKDYGNNGCEGGLMDQAFQYVKDNKGIDTESSYPYQAEDMRCRFNRSGVGASDKGFSDVPRGKEDALRDAVASVGPVSVAIDASHRSFQFYAGGIYDEPECSSEALDHGVLCVGYGTDEDGTDYWLVKNSWGPSWGDQGYVKMTRNKENQCGVATQASYPLV